MHTRVTSADSARCGRSNVSRQIPHPGVSCHDAGTQGVESGGTLHVMALFTHVMPYRSHRS